MRPRFASADILHADPYGVALPNSVRFTSDVSSQVLCILETYG